jgi:hypothetical protein
MFNDSQLALLKSAVRVLVEHEQRFAGEIHEELQELYDHFHSAPVVAVDPAPIVEVAPVVEAPVAEEHHEDVTLTSTDK